MILKVPVLSYYYVNEIGEVFIDKGEDKGIVLASLEYSHNGRPRIRVSEENRKTYWVDELIAITFIGLPRGSQEIENIDGDVTNVGVKNLKWVWPMGVSDFDVWDIKYGKYAEDPAHFIATKFDVSMSWVYRVRSRETRSNVLKNEILDRF